MTVWANTVVEGNGDRHLKAAAVSVPDFKIVLCAVELLEPGLCVREPDSLQKVLG